MMALVVSDEQLLTRAAAGDKAAEAECVERFRSLALSLTRGYFVQGGDRADIEQEALIGVMRAARSWRPGLEASGASFVALCVRRQLITAVKMATRVKHEMLSKSIRQVRNSDNELEDVTDLLPTAAGDPAAVAIAREELRECSDQLRLLSPLETRALLGVSNGIPYEEISAAFGVGFKTIDNAVQRARVKLEHQDSPNSKRLYRCPTCSGATVKRVEGSRGRPPRCNVCVARDALKAAA